MIFKPFTSHPASVGESYWQHFRFAGSTGAAMILGGCACIAHGLFPFLFTKTGSAIIARLHTRMSAGARHQTMAQHHGATARQAAAGYPAE